MNRRQSLVALSSLGVWLFARGGETLAKASSSKTEVSLDKPFSDSEWKTKDEKFWREKLSSKEFYILREKGTERAHTGRYWDLKKPGTYHCAGCDLELFDSSTKYDSKTGWPSFYDVIEPTNILRKDDYSLWSGKRIEILCARCEGHLGHVFSDGPPPTGLRYCMNGYALKFYPK